MQVRVGRVVTGGGSRRETQVGMVGVAEGGHGGGGRRRRGRLGRGGGG